MTEPTVPERQAPQGPQLSPEEIAAGDKYADLHDPGPGEQYAGEPVPDPWEETSDGELDPGAVPGNPQD